MNEYKKRSACASCCNTQLKEIAYLGNVPLAGNFPTLEELQSVKRYDLSLVFCENCKLVQTDSIIDSDTLFKDYRYMSSIGLSKHFESVANLYKQRFHLDESHEILEIGSNDGVLLKPFMNLGLNCLGIEPATNICEVAKSKGCNTINDYFSEDTAKKYFRENQFDLIVANNCFAHIDDIRSIVKGVKYAMKENGHFVIEVHYLKNLVKDLQYDFIYHEHLYYYSLTALYNLFKQFGMSICDYEEIDIHSGSIRVYIKKDSSEVYHKVEAMLELESSSGLIDESSFNKFGEKIKRHIRDLKDKLLKLKKSGHIVVGYGASGRGNMLLNMCEITHEEIDYIVDESPERVGRFIPCMNIPIVKPHKLNEIKPDYIVIFAWNYFDAIKNKIENLGIKDAEYILPFTINKIQ